VYGDRKLVLTCSLAAVLVALCLCSCGEKAPTIEKSKDSGQLAGTWVLKSRVTEGEGQGAQGLERQMKLVFTDDQLFRAEFRENSSQKWIRAGQGSFSYKPPLLTMYWESGTINPLLIVEEDPNTIVLHHCRTMIPVKDQEPSEIFVRQKSSGPTRKAS
jgi:hypothetical protein